MRFSSLFQLGFVSIAAAVPDFAIGTQFQFTATNEAQLNSVSKALNDAFSSYQASVTAQPEWTSAYSALVQFQKTHDGVPEDVIATDTVVQYATTPSWYTAMPTDLQNYLNKNREEQGKLFDKIRKDITGDAPRPVGMGVYMHGAVVAVIAGVAIML